MSDTVMAAIITGGFGLMGIALTYFFTSRATKKALIKNKNGSIHNINCSLISCNYMEMISEARNSIFFSGTGMSLLANSDLRNSLSKIDKKVSISFFVTDCCGNEASLNYKREAFGENREYYKSRMLTFISGINAIKSYRNVDLTLMDLFLPVAYFAIDYKNETKSSFIQAKYYLMSKEKGDAKVFYCTVHPGAELYKIYQEQILLIEKNKGRMAHRANS